MNRTKQNVVSLIGVLTLWSISSFILVDAHSYFSSITIDGVVHTEGDCIRPHPSSRYDYPISGVDRTTGLTSNDMTCGWLPAAANKANKKCAVNPGSVITLQWHYEMGLGSSDNFIIDPSHKGPCLVYMAKSETGSGAVWFKIFEDGYDSSTKKWCVDKLRANGGKFSVTIPTDITPGPYLFRAELIALHEGFELNGAQPYLHCAEINVTGSGTRNPTGLVSIPGVYSANDPGIYFDIYRNFNSYPIPGPAVYVSGSGSGTPPPVSVTTSPRTSGKVTTKSVATTAKATTGVRATTAKATTGQVGSTSSSTSTSTSTTTTSSSTSSGRATTSKVTSGRVNTPLTTGGSTAMCYLPGTPNINGTILKSPPYCGKNARRARCADGQCCSKYGYCGPIPDSNGRYYEEIDGVYKEVTYEVAVPLYCTNNVGDYRKVPCASLSNKNDVDPVAAGSTVQLNILLLLCSMIFAVSWTRFIL